MLGCMDAHGLVNTLTGSPLAPAVGAGVSCYVLSPSCWWPAGAGSKEPRSSLQGRGRPAPPGG